MDLRIIALMISEFPLFEYLIMLSVSESVISLFYTPKSQVAIPEENVPQITSISALIAKRFSVM